MDRSVLGEEKVGTVKRKIAVDLIGRNLMLTCISVFVAGIEKHLSSENIRFEENLGIFD